MQYEHLIAFSRYPVTLVLFAVFIWQCHKSFDSWQDPKMVTVFTEEEIDSVLYPSVTFCPMRQDEAQEAEGDNLKDIYESKMEPYEKVVMMVKQANRVDETKE